MQAFIVRALVLFTVAGVAAIAAAPAAAKPERSLNVSVAGKASNGYHYELEAYRRQPGGGAALLTLTNGRESALYVQRRARVSKQRVIARFNGLGKVSLHSFHKLFGARGIASSRCRRGSLSVGTFNGLIRFDGEHGFSGIRAHRATGGIQSTTRKRCRASASVQSPRPYAESAVLASCGGERGAGFLAAEEGPREPVNFFASKIERTDGLIIVRTQQLGGPTRLFDVASDLKSAKLRPPQPFKGRAELATGKLTGRLTAALPGAPDVRLTPSTNFSLTRFDDFELPKCLFPSLSVRQSNGGSAESVARERTMRTVLGRSLSRLVG